MACSMAAILCDAMSRCALIRINEVKNMGALIFDAQSIYEGCLKNNVTFIASPLLQMLK